MSRMFFGYERSRQYDLDTRPGLIAHWILLILGLGMLLAGGILLLLHSEAVDRRIQLILAASGVCCLVIWFRQRENLKRLREKQEEEPPREL